MSVERNKRFKSGETCVQSGCYSFDGYLNGAQGPEPALPEREIRLTSGEVFPPVASAWKGCWWVWVDEACVAGSSGARQESL